MSIRVCVIGCGAIARNTHIPAFESFPEYEIVGVMSRTLEHAKQTAETYKIPHAYGSAEEMLEREHPDLVDICTPNMSHKYYVELALKAGCNVLCEKPLVFSYAEAKELFSLAEKQNKVLVACQSRRFTPEYLLAKEYIDAHDFGPIYFGEFKFLRRRGIPTWGEFHKKEQSGGGSFIDLGVHSLDSMLWFMGNPKPLSVNAAFYQEIPILKEDYPALETRDQAFNPSDMDVDEFATGWIRFENGATCSFETSWALNAPDELSMRICSPKYGIQLPQSIVYYGNETTDSLDVQEFKEQKRLSGHKALIGQLRDALLGKAPLPVKPDETLYVTAILDLATRSAKEHREVFFSELETK